MGHTLTAGNGSKYNAKWVSLTAVTVGEELNFSHMVCTRKLAQTKLVNTMTNQVHLRKKQAKISSKLTLSHANNNNISAEPFDYAGIVFKYVLYTVHSTITSVFSKDILQASSLRHRCSFDGRIGPGEFVFPELLRFRIGDHTYLLVLTRDRNNYILYVMTLECRIMFHRFPQIIKIDFIT